jgi:hypothetical protein
MCYRCEVCNVIVRQKPYSDTKITRHLWPTYRYETRFIQVKVGENRYGRPVLAAQDKPIKFIVREYAVCEPCLRLLKDGVPLHILQKQKGVVYQTKSAPSPPVPTVTEVVSQGRSILSGGLKRR